MSKEENKKEEPNKRGRGRPKGSSDKPKVAKIKLKPIPSTAKEDFKKEYKDLYTIAIYGVDSFTSELLRYLWTDPQKEFVVTDPIPEKVAHLTREIGSLPYSLYRYETLSHIGWIEQGMFPVVVVAEEYWDVVSKLPNPEEVELVCLSHWKR
jgi:hypothetical protein